MVTLGWIIAIGLWTNLIASVIPWKKQPRWRQRMHLGISVVFGVFFILKIIVERQ